MRKVWNQTKEKLASDQIHFEKHEDFNLARIFIKIPSQELFLHNWTNFKINFINELRIQSTWRWRFGLHDVGCNMTWFWDPNNIVIKSYIKVLFNNTGSVIKNPISLWFYRISQKDSFVRFQLKLCKLITVILYETSTFKDV